MFGAGGMLTPQGFQKFLLCAFLDNARIVEYVSAIGCGGLIGLCATINVIILCLYISEQ